MLKNHCFCLCFRPLALDLHALRAIKVIAFAGLVLLTTQTAVAARLVFSGVVTRVVDGDTLWVKTNVDPKPLKVRLHGIDAPEICQSGGIQARDALKRRVLGQGVMVTSGAHDDYGRTVGILHLQGQDVGLWLVTQGYAWTYSYRHKKGPYAQALHQAQVARRGVFSVAGVEEPRLFRKRHGSCYVKP